MKLGRPVALALLCILLVLVFTWAVVPALYGRVADPGAFGDMFGFANALFSGLALAGVIVAILLQSRELSLQRSELERATVEMARQREQFEEQTRLFKEDQAQRTFYQLLGRHSENLRTIQIRRDTADASGLLEGRAALQDYIEQFRKQVASLDTLMEHEPPDRIGELRTGYTKFFDTVKDDLLPYLKHFRVLVDFVGSQPEHRLFQALAVAQLGPSELVLLYYDSLLRDSPAITRECFDGFGLLAATEPRWLLSPKDRDLWV